MLYKALVSFSGAVSMVTDEIRDIADPSVAKDLEQAGYIKPVNEEKKKPAKGVRNEQSDKNQ